MHISRTEEQQILHQDRHILGLDQPKDNQPKPGHLQTRLLEMNLINVPHIVDTIPGNQMFSHIDKAQIVSSVRRLGSTSEC